MRKTFVLVLALALAGCSLRRSAYVAPEPAETNRTSYAETLRAVERADGSCIWRVLSKTGLVAEVEVERKWCHDAAYYQMVEASVKAQQPRPPVPPQPAPAAPPPPAPPKDKTEGTQIQ